MTWLFSIQKNGTSKIGSVFSPTMMVWFFTIGTLGFMQVIKAPEVIMALNPIWVVNFFRDFSLHDILVILGFVMIAVSGDMLIATIAVSIIALLKWKWNKLLAIPLFIFFGFIDVTFLVANSLKFMEGGYVPLSIGVIILSLMLIWKMGNSHIDVILRGKQNVKVSKLLSIRDASTAFTASTTIILSRTFIKSIEDKIPPISKLYLDKYVLIPKQLIFLTINMCH